MAGGLALHDTLQQITTIAYGVWRKRWYALSTAWLISIIGWFSVATVPYQYESVAKVKIDSDAILQGITQIISTNNSQNPRRNTQAIRDRMTTRSNLERIIRRTNYLERLAGSEIETNQLIFNMKRDIIIRPSGQDVYTISYTVDDDRLSDIQRSEVARDVVVGLVDVFISDKTSSGNADNALEFLTSRIEDLKSNLDVADREKITFQQKNLEILSGNAISSKLGQSQANLANTQNEISELKASVRELEQNLKNIPVSLSNPVASGGGSSRGSPSEERLANLLEDLDKLYLKRYQEKHPDVVAIKIQIEDLKKQIETEQEERRLALEEAAKTGRGSNKVTLTPNPLYEDLLGRLILQRSELKKLEIRLGQDQKTYNNLRIKAESAPEILAEWQRLEEDSEAMERELRNLRRREQELKTADKAIEVDSKSFAILEEATTPQKPSGPPRILWLTFTLAGALVAGVALSLVLFLIKPVVVTVDQLRLGFDYPILGNITRVLSEKDAKDRMVDLLAFGGLSGFLFLAYLGLIGLNMFGV